MDSKTEEIRRRVPNRIVLKLSGRHMGLGERAFEPSVLWPVCCEILAAQKKGIQIAIVGGGGNIARGKPLVDNIRVLAEAHGLSVNAESADALGMLATLLNGVFMKIVFDTLRAPFRLVCAFETPELRGLECELFDPDKQREQLEAGEIVIIAGGMGIPGITTDTAAMRRALQLDASRVVKATRAKGIFSGDPYDPDRKFDPTFFPNITCTRIRELGLRGVLDKEAVDEMVEHSIPLQVFDGFASGHITRALNGEHIGTLVEPI